MRRDDTVSTDAPQTDIAPKTDAEEPRGLQLEPYQVVLRPLVTEKGTHLSERHNAYTFEINPQATKEDVRRAVEAIWGVRVVSIRTQNRKGKPRRHRMQMVHAADWKKAIVQLHDEDRISFF